MCSAPTCGCPTPPPDEQAPGEDAPKDAHTRYEQRRQELQVRLTAQRILAVHLRPVAAEAFWADIDLDLTGAHLYQLSLGACRVRSVQFGGTTFTGAAWFTRATFTGAALFIDAGVHRGRVVHRGDVHWGRVVYRRGVHRGREVRRRGVHRGREVRRGDVHRGRVVHRGYSIWWGARGPGPSRHFTDWVDHPRRAPCGGGGRRLAVRGARRGFERAAPPKRRMTGRWEQRGGGNIRLSHRADRPGAPGAKQVAPAEVIFLTDATRHLDSRKRSDRRHPHR